MPVVSRKSGSRKQGSKDESTKNKPKARKLKTSLKTARIQSAVEKGKQILLPSETKGLNLSKFEHNGRDGRLAVYAEELYHMYDVFGHYKVIAAFQPVNSVQNQLFFGTATHKRGTKIRQSSCDRKPLSEPAEELCKQTHFPTPTTGTGVKNRRQTNPDTFEELILRYKAQRERNQTGKQHLEVLEMLDSIYKRTKEEWSRVEREFSSLKAIRRELTRQETEMNLRLEAREQRRQADFKSGKCERQRSDVKLPVIKVSSVHDEGKRKVSKQDSKRLKIPKERVNSSKNWTTGVT